MAYYDSHNLFPVDNVVIESKIKDQLLTKLDMYQFATLDTSLTENVGNVKKIRTYIGTGYAQDVEMGEGNTVDIGAGYVESDYRVKFCQDRFPYFDEQYDADNKVVDAGIKRSVVAMTNDMTSKVVAELGKATMVVNNFGWDFDGIVDAVAMFPDETVEGLFLLINKKEEAKIKKNCKQYLSYPEAYIRTGFVGMLDSIPIYVSASVPEGVGFLANKEAVTIFTKHDISVAQEREENTRKNIVYTRFCNVVAITDTDKVIKLNSNVTFVPEAKDAKVKVSMIDRNAYKVVGKGVTQGFTDDEFGTVTGKYTLLEIPACLSVGSHHIKQINPALKYFYDLGASDITIVDGQYVKEKDYTITGNPDAFKFMMGNDVSEAVVIIDGEKYTFTGKLAFAE